ncbi:homoserine dehydrogenase [bacterium]|nr:homoserine dehydrogenase [bacterium]
MSDQTNNAPLRVGLLGLGTVGQGVLSILARNGASIAERAGRPITVTMAAVRDTAKSRGDLPEGLDITTDPMAVVNSDSVDVVVELMGGIETPEQFVRAALQAGKPVVTANKALLALRGEALFDLARQHNAPLAFEAAVAGGIPLIKALREGLAANVVSSIAGIINGTCNYILTQMDEAGTPFADVLAEAQRLGYAEADPSFDIDGIDAAHKLTLLASIAFGIPLSFDKVHCEGVGLVSVDDIRYAAELGYRIKHLGIARLNNGGVELRVHPTLLPKSELLANVNGVLNATVFGADAASPTGYFGPGAGGEATASAVLADVVDIARGASMPGLGGPAASDLAVLPIEDAVSGHYLRLRVADVPGVLTAISGILAQAQISIEAINQKEIANPGSDTNVVILTAPVQERTMRAAVEQMMALDSVRPGITRIRVEHTQ